MKKIYMMGILAMGSLGAGAQLNDTIYQHIAGTPAYYNWTGGAGYVTGTNSYGDKAIVQLFDMTHGVLDGSGTINGVLIWAASKDDAGGSYTVNVWSDNAGVPGAVLGSTTVTLAATDTSAMALSGLGSPLVSAYNVNAAFGTPIAIPASKKFWAGVVLPTTAAAGDTLVLISNQDGNFADAATHSGVIDATDAFFSYNAAGIDIASAIFPYVTYTSVAGIEETAVAAQVYPNPTSGLVNFQFANTEVSSLLVTDLSGRVVSTINVNGATTIQADFSELANGTYLYETVTFDGVISSKAKFVKQ